MTEQAETADVLGLTAQIVSAHVSNNAIGAEALPSLIQDVYRTLAGVGKEQVLPDKQQPAVPIKKSVFPDFIVCLEDGKKLKMLKRHLKTSYNMTPRTIPREVAAHPRLPHGRTQLRQAPLLPRQEDRPRHQAPRPLNRTRRAALRGSPVAQPAIRHPVPCSATPRTGGASLATPAPAD